MLLPVVCSKTCAKAAQRHLDMAIGHRQNPFRMPPTRRDTKVAGATGLEDTELDAEGQAYVSGTEDVFLVCRDEGAVRVIAIAPDARVVIGRAPDSTVVSPSARVSRLHASIERKGKMLSITDHGSRNGTLVNGKLLRDGSRAIDSGDVIAIGGIRIVVAKADPALSRGLVEDARPRRAPTRAEMGEGEGADPSWADALVLADRAMVKLASVARRVAAAQSAVLVVGETGTGKELIAERIHRQSARRAGPFLRLNCASLPEALIESELFGHEKGAFTGADRKRTGYFEAANGGTLLLDEIGEMPPNVQAKLLRVLERRAIVRVGGTEEVPVDVRIICATNRDLRREVEAGGFRRDLYYRISTFTMEVPPLRERPTEILLLAELFAARFAQDLGLSQPVLGTDVVEALAAHSWPGNVRELRNAMEHAVVMANGAPLRKEHLPLFFEPGASAEGQGIRNRMEGVERAALVAALATERGNRTRAAKRLGLSRRALLYKILKYGLRD
jgi:two-component system response regulator AtoC